MSDYDQWRTDCPKCGHETLLVSEVILCATGEKLYPHSELCGDGFDVDPRSELPDSIKDQSTEDEKVLCPKCKAEFDLSDLTLEAAPEPGKCVDCGTQCVWGDVGEALCPVCDAKEIAERWVEKHSVNCIKCNELVDERECISGPNGEGDICPKCHAKKIAERHSPDRFTQVEYDPTFFGGDYSKVGFFVLLSHKEIHEKGSVEKAFVAKFPTMTEQNIIHYCPDEVYDKDGEEI